MLFALISLPNRVAGCRSNVALIAVNLPNIILVNIILPSIIVLNHHNEHKFSVSGRWCLKVQ